MFLDDLREQLIRDEGTRLKPYRDTVGKLTIGVGRNLDDEGISADEAALMLNNDIARHQAKLYADLPWVEHLDEPRRGVLLNMAFNLGTAGLEGFHQMLAKVESGDFVGAAGDMLDSKWARQVGPRAYRLSMQMRTGIWT